MKLTGPPWLRAAAPSLLTILLANPAGGLEPVRVNGSEFQVCNQNFRFMGFNLRGICHYGYGDVLPYSYTSDIATNLNYCVAAGAKVIRLFCAYSGIGPVETGDRLEVVLNACQQRGMYAIITLTDMYGGTQLHPMGDSVDFTDGLLNHAFFSGGYTVNYLPQALYLADRFKDHPAVFAWQLGNEIRDIGHPATYAAFAADMATQLRTVDPNHLLSTGLIGYENAQLTFGQAQQLYAAFDFVSSHHYNGEESNDHQLAAAVSKPHVIGEAGFDSNVYGPDRTALTDADIAKWTGRGARGYLNWGLMATEYDNGDGDRRFGIDPVFHEDDFLGYRGLFLQWATALSVPPPPPELEVTPAMLSQTQVAGTTGTQILTVLNLGTGQFPFTVSVTGGAGWLSVSPASGQVACRPVSLQVNYQSGQMLSGVYTGALEVTAPGVAGSPRAVAVTMTLTPRPGDFDGDNDVDQSDFGAFQRCWSGEGIAQHDPECLPGRLDGDSDVDSQDLTVFLRCMSGPGIPSFPECTS